MKRDFTGLGRRAGCEIPPKNVLLAFQFLEGLVRVRRGGANYRARLDTALFP